MVVAAFDFDGTLTTKDTFLEFIKFTHGKTAFTAGFLLLAPVLVLYKARIIPNYKAKRIAFGFFYKGWSIEKFNRCCDLFAAKIDTFLRPETNRSMHEHIEKGDTVIVISASIENWISPWAKSKGVYEIAGTRIETSEGIITGKFASENCYGKEKVNRLLEIFPDRSAYTLYAYGDSRGDKELLEIADKKIKI